jgi:F0F1-type ATP synthase delta subunit
VETKAPISLPESISTKQDLLHVVRELQNFVDRQTQDSIRGKQAEFHDVSDMLQKLAETNGVDLQEADDCKNLLTSLEAIKKSHPSVHLSFASEPSKEVLKKIVLWFRKNTNANVLIQVGLQPSIAAGVILRTPNKSFDFSLRTKLHENRNKLIEVLNAK